MKNTTKESTSIYSPTILESLLNLNCKTMPNPEEESFKELVENKFYCSRKFVEEIESIALENKDMKYIDAIVFFCEKNNVDIESVPKLISKPLKEKLRGEAMELNLLKRTSHAKLPI